jgi:hypothetical protein
MPWAKRVSSYLAFVRPERPHRQIDNPPARDFFTKKGSAFREVRMARIRLPAMPRSTAEDALIELWILLEKYGLETPVLTVSFQPDGQVSLNLVIREPARTARLYRGWARQWQQGKCAALETGIPQNGSPMVALANAG